MINYKINKDMDKEMIAMQEEANDGQTVYLYYDTMAGVYLAYGLSAYYTTLVTDPYMSYSEEMEMPVALLRRNHVNDLRQGMTKVEHTVKSFYRFQLTYRLGKEGYDKWAQKILKKHLTV